ncbi:cell envelope biogenesis protein AsmA [Vibrio sp. 10N.286.49.B3]|uniref:AsmA family protein n=1 Tax=Vibrio sp. 10N.286.49.B3 TaxID=1880855 RepID=UPI000C8263CB|nr:AsmA family protein [Vibrio sp. 10N.286.49.B3]PMH46823.1 cell envelope biogenesis protein AsmA [Vibrio sp. 10N.286.49.B3]
MKKLLLFISVIFAIIIAAIITLIVVVDPNQFKPLITEQAKQKAGLDIAIEGDISWTFFPTIGFEMGETSLKNPPGFSQSTLLDVSKVGIEVSVMPLLSQKLNIGNVVLDGAQIRLETLADGRTNLDELTQKSPVEQEQSTANDPVVDEASTPAEQAWDIVLQGVTISNALLEIQNHQTKTYSKLYDVGLTLSEFSFDEWTQLGFQLKGENNQQQFSAHGKTQFKLAKNVLESMIKELEMDVTFDDGINRIESASIQLDQFQLASPSMVNFAIKGDFSDLAMEAKGNLSVSIDQAMNFVDVTNMQLDSTLIGEGLPQSPLNVNMNSALTFDLAKSYLDFNLKTLALNAIQLDGNANVTLAAIPKVRFALHSANIDLDEFLGLDTQTEGTDTSSKSGSQPADAAEIEPDLSALKSLDVKGIINIDAFKAGGAHLQNVAADFSVNRGVVDLSSLSAQLYQGSIAATARLDARQAVTTYQFKNQIKAVKVQPLLADVADNDKLEGTGNIDIDIKGQYLAPTNMKKNLTGTIAINFADGAVNGINIAQMIRENYAKIKGQSLDGNEGVQKTDFSAMTGTFVLANGEMTTNNLHAQSPLLRVTGEGTANYLQETTDFLVSTSIVGSLEGQGGQDISELKDVTIPIQITGSWAQPKFKLIFDDVLKEKVEKEVQRGVDKLTDKIKDDKTKEAVNSLLKGLFN